jgi:ubiquinone/menaquinone biosynthesis C-methylase UbiE
MINRNLFSKTYWWLQKYIAPELQYSQAIYEKILNEYCVANIQWLDLGSGHQILPPWRLEQEEKKLVTIPKLIVGLDYDWLSLTKHKTIKNLVRGDITKLPFPDNSFDLITSNMVFEHLNNPQQQLNEISRILKVGGKLIFHTPNKLSYTTLMARIIPEKIKDKLIYILEGRKKEDVFPAFYKINSPSEINRLATESEFKIVKIKLICSSAQFIIIPPLVSLN